MVIGASAASQQAAAVQAIRASGAIVRVEPLDFKAILWKNEDGLVVTAEGGLFKKSFQYLTAYKGLVFYTKSPEPLELGNRVELIKAGSIWIPG